MEIGCTLYKKKTASGNIQYQNMDTQFGDHIIKRQTLDVSSHGQKRKTESEAAQFYQFKTQHFKTFEQYKS